MAVRDVGALLYLEARMFVNRVRQILRRPGRLILWLLFLVWVGAFLFMRGQSLGSGGILFPGNFHRLLAFVPGVYLVILGIQILVGCRRPPAAFAYPADARFLFGSRLPPRMVVLWLQLREAVFAGGRLLFVVFVAAWWSLVGSGRTLLTAALALAGAYVIAFGLRLPSFLISRRFPGAGVRWIGIGSIVIGLTTLAVPIVIAAQRGDYRLSFISRHAPQLPPGTWIVSALAGHSLQLLPLWSLAVALLVVGSIAAGDAYPELWEASLRLYRFRALAASGKPAWSREALRRLRSDDPNLQRLPTTAHSVTGLRTPGGAWTILWKDWLALVRSPGGLRWPLLWIAGSVVLGFAAGVAARDYSLIALLPPAVAIGNTIVFIGSQTMVALGPEIRRPLWWLSPAPLRERLAVWSGAGLLRVAPPLAAAIVTAAIVIRSPVTALLGAPLVVVLLMLVRAIGLGCYVFLPGRNDLRGPGFLLRTFATYVALVPPVVAWLAAQAFSHSLALGACAGMLIAVLEILAFIGLATLRLQEDAMSYVAAEER